VQCLPVGQDSRPPSSKQDSPSRLAGDDTPLSPSQPRSHHAEHSKEARTPGPEFSLEAEDLSSSSFQQLSPQEAPDHDTESKNEDRVAKLKKLYSESGPGGGVVPRAKAVVAKSAEQLDDGQVILW